MSEDLIYASERTKGTCDGNVQNKGMNVDQKEKSKGPAGEQQSIGASERCARSRIKSGVQKENTLRSSVSQTLFDILFVDGTIRREVPFSALRPIAGIADALKALRITRKEVTRKFVASQSKVSPAALEDAALLSAASLLRQATVFESLRLQRVSSLLPFDANW